MLSRYKKIEDITLSVEILKQNKWTIGTHHCLLSPSIFF